MSPEEFQQQFMPYAQDVSQRTGLDPRLVLAQAALETGYGRSAPNNNFFGIKSHGQAGGSNLMTQEFENGRMVSRPQSFRGYEGPEQSFQGYADFILNNPRYGDVMAQGDLAGQIGAMGQSGYATDPDYASKLSSIARRFGGDVPDAPMRARVSNSNSPTGGILSNEGNQMAQPQQPQGLLGSMGIQRRDPTAQGETSQPFYNRRSFGDTLARLAPALGRMGVMGLEGPAQAALDSRNERQGDERAQQAQARQRNDTAEWLRSLGSTELADGVANGSLTGAQAMSQHQANAAANAPMSEMEQIQLEMAQAELDQLRTPPPDREGEAKLRGEFTSLPIVKSFSDQSTAYGRVMASVNDPSPAGDLALIFNFMKVLDPGSTVREGEFATAANSGGVDDRVRALYNNVTEGTRLAPTQRDDFASRATQLYSNAEQQYRGIADQYSAFAVQSGFDPATMMPDFTYSGDRYQTPMSLTPPQLTGAQLVQMGLSAQEWQDTWATFTDQERQEFLGAN
jgi:hypothetical protein